jgi:hypothetical protein
MTVLSYGGTAAVVLALCWAAVRLSLLPRRNPPLAALAVFALVATTRWRRRHSPRSPRVTRCRSPHSGREQPSAVTIW